MIFDLTHINYRIIKEYSMFYKNTSNNVCNNICDNFDKSSITNPNQINCHINSIYNYIKLSYYLSFIKQCDTLTLNNNKIMVNIDSESIHNKKNRELERKINCMDTEYILELYNTWCNIDHNESKLFLILLPYKWILLEYRSLFRTIHNNYIKTELCDPIQNFNTDYCKIENIVNKLSSTIHNVFRNDIIPVPKFYLSFINYIIDVFLFIIDIYLSMTLLSYFSMGYIIVPVITCILFHTIIVSVIYTIKNMISEFNYNFDKTNNNNFDISDTLNIIINESIQLFNN
jgi:hypothetical protein